MVSATIMFALFAAILINVAWANDNGLAVTPPMGWRSWNQFLGDVDQTLIQLIMNGMVDRGRVDHTGRPTSLCDRGYCDVGLDDNWQACGSPDAAPGMNYHDMQGNPIVNMERFPNLQQMTDYGHSLNLTVGWYGNNCICKDLCRNKTECDMQIRADVEAFIRFGFDSWKLDGCGNEKNLAAFDKYLRQSTTQPIMVENCNWGRQQYDPDPSLPPRQGCPFNFYRSSGDIQLSYASVLSNLASVERYRARNMSAPGCWSYPDMLQVGIRNHLTGEIGLTRPETRSHFGAWCIVSSPLFLGHNTNDVEVTDLIWDIITNREAIEVNQAYAGDSGGIYETSPSFVEIEYEHLDGLDSIPGTRSTNRKLGNIDAGTATFPSYQYLSKPLDGNGRVAVLLINSSAEATKLTATFSDIPRVYCNPCKIRNIWKHQDEGEYHNSWSVIVESRDAAFIVVE